MDERRAKEECEQEGGEVEARTSGPRATMSEEDSWTGDGLGPKGGGTTGRHIHVQHVAGPTSVPAISSRAMLDTAGTSSTPPSRDRRRDGTSSEAKTSTVLL